VSSGLVERLDPDIASAEDAEHGVTARRCDES
jgi:hypothetical protein